jgi:ABC-type nitrate/sulfonate/bicarbonate transport system ATPase subunit
MNVRCVVAANDRHKRERLQIANSVLKLTQKLLKENDSSPNKLSGGPSLDRRVTVPRRGARLRACSV